MTLQQVTQFTGLKSKGEEMFLDHGHDLAILSEAMAVQFCECVRVCIKYLHCSQRTVNICCSHSCSSSTNHPHNLSYRIQSPNLFCSYFLVHIYIYLRLADSTHADTSQQIRNKHRIKQRRQILLLCTQIAHTQL